MPDTSVSIQAPYEGAIIALINLITKVIDGQPPEVKAKLWELYLQDVLAWREFWKFLQPK